MLEGELAGGDRDDVEYITESMLLTIEMNGEMTFVQSTSVNGRQASMNVRILQ